MNIKKLQLEIYNVNASKGWHQEPLLDDDGSMIPNRVITKLALIGTELTEAKVEAHHGRFGEWYSPLSSKPEGYVIELADALIRALDTCEALNVTIYPLRADTLTRDERLSARTMVDAAIEAVRIGDVSKVCDALSALWVECHWLAYERRLDLDKAIQTKIAYNRTRLFRHGGKSA